jgi:hypothetical protein
MPEERIFDAMVVKLPDTDLSAEPLKARVVLAGISFYPTLAQMAHLG